MSDAAPIPVSLSRAWLRVAALFVAGLFAAAQFAKVSVALPWLEAAYPEGGAWLALAVSANGVAGILLGAMAGALVARVGPRRMLGLGLAAGGVLSLVQSLGLPFVPFMLLRLLEGSTHLVIVVAAPTLMAASAPGAARPVAMGLWGTFVGVGFAVTAVLGTPLLESGGAGLLFAAHGAGMLALALLLPRMLPHLAPAPATRLSAAAIHRATYGEARRAAPALGFVWYTLNFVALVTFLPPLLGPGAAVVLPLVGLVGTFGAGALARRWPPFAIGIAGFALSALLMLAIWIVPDPARLPVAVLAFVALGLIPGATFAAVPRLNPAAPDQARANGAIAQLGNVGSTLGTPLFALALAAGPLGLSALSAALCLCGVLTLAVFHRKLAGKS